MDAPVPRGLLYAPVPRGLLYAPVYVQISRGLPDTSTLCR